VPATRFHGWFVAATAMCVLLFGLGGPALWDDDEPKNAACSLAMLDSHDWVVPTFNGRLRVEKPPLVNWLHLAGFTVCGRNETGARLGSALLTIGTCLLTWQIGSTLLGPATGLLGGLAMATCVWTAVGGRAATPDAPLLFFTTLAFFLFVRGAGIRAGGGGGVPTVSLWSAVGIGGACGAATLAKGPVGLALPLLAFLAFAAWRRRSCPQVGWAAALGGIRPLTIVLAAAAVAAPWYAWVTFRTDGEWLRGFLFVHNIGRFASAMEGHSGSILYYPTVVAVGLFPWSIVLAAMLAHAAFILRSRGADDRREPLQLLACWAIVWIGGFSCAGTKLPGYIWPAYPALAIATGLFLANWADGRADFPWPRFPERFRKLRMKMDRDPDHLIGLVMRVAWSILAATGLALTIGLPMAANRLAPGCEWLGVLGLIPLAAAVVAWQSQSTGHRHRALTAMAFAACLLVTLMASLAAESFSRAQGPRTLIAQLGEPAKECQWACLWNVPPSLVFYTGARIEKLETVDDVAAHLRRYPRARVVIDSRQETLVAASLPPDCGVLSRVPTLAEHDFLLIGRLSDRDTQPEHDTPLAFAD
jgi:4-amino-4-deoxy-L-arabinose transferase-like glycosyltransferase